MLEIRYNMSDVDFGWSDDGFWFSCSHPLNYEAFIKFIKPVYRVFKNTQKNFAILEDSSHG